MKQVIYKLLIPIFFIAFISCSPTEKSSDASNQPTKEKEEEKVEVKTASFHDEWSYDGKTGPEYWQELSNYYSQCGCGHSQSPIDVLPNIAEHINEPLKIKYTKANIDFVNNGHTIKELVHTTNLLTFGDKQYQLLQFHFHTPAEHYLDHKQYPMELHFVHMSKDKDVAVLAVFVNDTTVTNSTLSLIQQYVPKHKSEELIDKYEMDLNRFLPVDLSYYHYSGSLTTPPCSEGVKWVILNNPINATREQIESIHSIIHDDNRPLQALEGRHIYTSN